MSSSMKVKRWIKKCTLTSFVALGMQSEGNAPKKRTNSWFLLNDNAPAHRSVSVKDFLAKNKVTTLQHPLTLLPWLQLIFTFSLHWNLHWKDITFVVLLTTLRMPRQTWQVFYKLVSRNVFKPLESLAEIYSFTRGLFLRECGLNDCAGLCFWEIKWIQEYFEATTYKGIK